MDYSEHFNSGKAAVCFLSVVDVRRQRATEAGKSTYVVVFDSFNIRPKSATFQLLNTANDIVFHAELFLLQDDTIRLNINEESPLVLRYEAGVGDVLTEEPQTRGSVTAVIASTCTRCVVVTAPLAFNCIT